jgi:hypothetical protein
MIDYIYWNSCGKQTLTLMLIPRMTMVTILRVSEFPTYGINNNEFLTDVFV